MQNILEFKLYLYIIQPFITVNKIPMITKPLKYCTY